MGLLNALRNLPFLVFGLLAGVLVDRVPRRTVLIGCSLAGAVLLMAIPGAAWLGVLGMPILYVEAFLHGTIGVIFGVAAQSLIPTLAGRERLVEANRNVQVTASGAQIVGPGLAGVLIDAVTAPVAIAIDAASYVVSAGLLVAMRVVERVRPDGARPRVVAEVREGLEIVLGDRHLRAIMLCGATHNFFSNGMLVALYVLFARERLGLTPTELGLIFAAGGPGSLLGGVLVARLARVLGLGPSIGAMQILTGVARLAIPAAIVIGPPLLVLAAGEFLLGVARTVFNVTQLSLRQSITPDHQQGRMNASIRFLMWAMVPLGALLGGWMAELVGMERTVLLGALGTLGASLWIFLGPVRRLRLAEEATPVRL